MNDKYEHVNHGMYWFIENRNLAGDTALISITQMSHLAGQNAKPQIMLIENARLDKYIRHGTLKPVRNK